MRVADLTFKYEETRNRGDLTSYAFLTDHGLYKRGRIYEYIDFRLIERDQVAAELETVEASVKLPAAELVPMEESIAGETVTQLTFTVGAVECDNM